MLWNGEVDKRDCGNSFGSLSCPRSGGTRGPSVRSIFCQPVSWIRLSCKTTYGEVFTPIAMMELSVGLQEGLEKLSRIFRHVIVVKLINLKSKPKSVNFAQG